jgi:tight adherence protein C
MTEAQLAGVCAAASVVLLVLGARMARSRVDSLVGPPPPSEAPSDGKMVFGRLAGRVGRSSLARRFDSGHQRELLALSGWRLAPSSLAGLRVIGAFLGAVGAAALPGPSLILAPVLAAVGSYAPGLVVSRAARRRREAINHEVPQFLDLLAATSSAGLGAQLALRRSVAVLKGPLGEELRGVVRSADLGSRWRDELQGLAARIDLPDLRRAVVALTRTETLGASLADASRDLAATVRQTRRAARTERARTAPVKMLFPLVFLVLPSFLLLTVVPVLLSTVQSIS